MKQHEARILIVHRDQVVSQALRHSLADNLNLHVFAAIGCDSVENISDCAYDFQPDIILLNVFGFDFSSVVRYLRNAPPDPRIVVFGLSDSGDDVLAAIHAGAVGCETISGSLKDLIAQLQALCDGEATCSPTVGRILFREIATGHEIKVGSAGKQAHILTHRERQIVSLIELGLSNKMIANELSIGLQTVKNHVHNILEKLQLNRRTEAAHYAREHGLLNDNDSSKTY